MIEIYFKYDKMHIFGMINAFIYINNHVNSCINSMLSVWLKRVQCSAVQVVHKCDQDRTWGEVWNDDYSASVVKIRRDRGQSQVEETGKAEWRCEESARAMSGLL